MAADCSPGDYFGCRCDFCLAKRREENRRLRLQVRLPAWDRFRSGEGRCGALTLSKFDAYSHAITKVSSTIHFVHHFHDGQSGEPATGRWTPHTDVYVCDNGLVIKVELAGMKSDSLEIIVDGQRLRITGVRPTAAGLRTAIFS